VKLSYWQLCPNEPWAMMILGLVGVASRPIVGRTSRRSDSSERKSNREYRDRPRVVFLSKNKPLFRFHWHAFRTRACHPGRADGANESTSTQSLALIGFS